MFKSTNGGISWTAINSGLKSLNIETFVIDPSNPSILYAGYVGSSHNLTFKGIAKTINGGISWTNVSIESQEILSLAIDPSNPSNIYAGSDGNGVFRSTNAGTSWMPVNTGLTATQVGHLAIDPNNTTMYAGTAGSGMFKSYNGGARWIAMNSGLTNFFIDALAAC